MTQPLLRAPAERPRGPPQPRDDSRLSISSFRDTFLRPAATRSRDLTARFASTVARRRDVCVRALADRSVQGYRLPPRRDALTATTAVAVAARRTLPTESRKRGSRRGGGDTCIPRRPLAAGPTPAYIHPQVLPLPSSTSFPPARALPPPLYLRCLLTDYPEILFVTVFK